MILRKETPDCTRTCRYQLHSPVEILHPQQTSADSCQIGWNLIVQLRTTFRVTDCFKNLTSIPEPDEDA